MKHIYFFLFILIATTPSLLSQNDISYLTYEKLTFKADYISFKKNHIKLKVKGVCNNNILDEGSGRLNVIFHVEISKIDSNLIPDNRIFKNVFNDGLLNVKSYISKPSKNKYGSLILLINNKTYLHLALTKITDRNNKKIKNTSLELWSYISQSVFLKRGKLTNIFKN